MAFTHTNKITYNYLSGGSSVNAVVSKSATLGAEMNISELVGTYADPNQLNDIEIEYFEFTTASKAESVYLMLDGYNGELWGGSSGGTKMVDLVSGEPYVWTKDGSANFPPGNTNPMVDSTDKLIVKPKTAVGGGALAGSDSCTLTVKVLYDPT